MPNHSPIASTILVLIFWNFTRKIKQSHTRTQGHCEQNTALTLYTANGSPLTILLASANLYILTKARPWDSAPECRSIIDAPPDDPPSANPPLAIVNRCSTSSSVTNESLTKRPQLFGTQAGNWCTSLRYDGSQTTDWNRCEIVSFCSANFLSLRCWNM